MAREKVRMCVACRGRNSGSAMLRIVRSKESGAAMLDRTGKYQGRGAYVCRNAECIKKARDRKSLARELKCEVGDELFEELLKEAEKES